MAPVLMALFLFMAPVLDRIRDVEGRWFHKKRWTFNIIFAALLLSQIAMILVGQWFRGKNWEFIVPW
jgi:hypothetical protein